MPLPDHITYSPLHHVPPHTPEVDIFFQKRKTAIRQIHRNDNQLLVTKTSKNPYRYPQPNKNTSHPQPRIAILSPWPLMPLSWSGPPSSLRWGYKPKHLKLEPWSKNTERWSPWVKEPPSRVIHPPKIHMETPKMEIWKMHFLFQRPMFFFGGASHKPLHRGPK